MSQKSSRPFSSQTQPEGTSPVLNFWSDLVREQYATAMGAACTWFRSRETLHQARQQATHQALMIHEAAAQKLCAANGPVDLPGIHSDLMSFYWENPIQYWQQVATTSMQTQIEMMAQMNHMFIGKTKDRMERALSNVPAALPKSEEAFKGNTGSPTRQPISRIASGKAMHPMNGHLPAGHERPPASAQALE